MITNYTSEYLQKTLYCILMLVTAVSAHSQPRLVSMDGPPFGGNPQVFYSPEGQPNSIYLGVQSSGIYHTSDFGLNWRKVANICNTYQYIRPIGDSLLMFTSESNIIYIVDMITGDVNKLRAYNRPVGYGIMSGDTVVSILRSGLAKSTDFGVTWWLDANGLPTLQDSINNIIRSIAWNGTDTYYCDIEPVGIFRKRITDAVWTLVHQTPGIFYRIEARDSLVFIARESRVEWSSNYGQTWSVLDSTINNFFGGTYASPGDYILADGAIREFHPQSNSWSSINSYGYAYQTIRLQNNSLISGGTLGGPFVSSDGGNNWDNRINGLNNSTVNAIVEFHGLQLFGTSPGQVFTHQNDSWEELVNSPYSVISFQQCGERLFAASWYGISYSDDGIQWTDANCPGSTIRSIVCIDSNQLLATDYLDGRLLRSLDGGRNWSYTNATFLLPRKVFLTQNGTLLVGDLNYIYRSTDNGASWTPVMNRIEINDIAQRSDGRLFATTSGGHPTDGVQSSTDDGVTWNRVGPASLVNASYIQFDSHDNVYVTTTAFLGKTISSSDNGTTWEQLLTNAPSYENSSGYDNSTLFIDSNDYLYHGLTYNGLYRTNAPITSIDETSPSILIPNNINLTVYPNPFNNSTNIVLKLTKYQPFQLLVYDNLGRQVTKLYDATIPTNTTNIYWNASTLTSGQYYLQLQTPETRVIRTLTIVK
ncbi:MAG: T9SS type A sorting domain-containing protein [bacterium]|nr:T9SS type A sorting domain-containing protein [bacterium]